MIDPGDHPRPDLRRERWTSLDGAWAFAFDDADAGLAGRWFEDPQALAATIRVPFVPQCAASGIHDNGAHEILWYARTFQAERADDERVLLHFGAVDHHARVWLNGRALGEHRGGYTPFVFDVSGVLQPGANLLVVRVEDRNRPDQVRGKQTPTFPYLITYTAASGIWQPVWLETVGRAWLSDVDLDADLARRRLRVRTSVQGEARAPVVQVRVRLDDAPLAEARGPADEPLDLVLPEVRAWSPAEPVLYDVELSLHDGDARLDTVHGYAGFRSTGIRDGCWRLNDEPLYQRLLLDQGYWPETNLTPPSAAAIREDLAFVREAGFDGVRKHQKIEDPRWLFWADRLGVLVWEEMPSPFPLARIEGALAEDYRREWLEAVRRDRAHPCIVCWVPFNESWGVLDLARNATTRATVADLVAQTRRLDPGRPVCDNSGWEHVDSDVVDVHDYAQDPARLHATWHDAAARDYARGRPELDPELAQEFKQRFNPERLAAHLGVTRLRDAAPFLNNAAQVFAPDAKRRPAPLIVSEIGGVGLVRPGEALPADTFVYNRVTSAADLLARFEALVGALERARGVQGWCWTQLADTEQEINGLLTEDRQPKIAARELAAALERIRALRAPR